MGRVAPGLRHHLADWINERSRGPGLVIGALAFVGIAVLFHGAPFAVLAGNYVVGKIPESWSVVQAIRIRRLDRWLRPQLFQRLASREELARVADAADAAAVRSGELGRWGRLCARNRVARFFDDWLNERSRGPHAVIEAVTMVTGLVGLHLGWLTFVLDWVIGEVPDTRSLYKAARHRDLKRWLRPGSYARPREAAKQERVASGVTAPLLTTRPVAPLVAPGLLLQRVGVVARAVPSPVVRTVAVERVAAAAPQAPPAMAARVPRGRPALSL